MLVTLSGFELEESLKDYLQKQFNRVVEVSVSDSQLVTASIELKEAILPIKTEVEEENHTHSVESDEPKPRRTRRKRVEVLDENDNKVSEVTVEESVEEEKTKYSDLPRLNQEDQTKYTQILTLLSNNPRNKNRLQLEELSTDLSTDLKTVLNASEHYQDWLKYCQEQDSETAMNEILKQEEPEITDEENIIDTEPTEPVNEPVEESLEDRTLRLMKEVNEEDQQEDNKVQEPEKPKKSLFGSPDNSVTKSGSFFNSQPTRRVF